MNFRRWFKSRIGEHIMVLGLVQAPLNLLYGSHLTHQARLIWSIVAIAFVLIGPIVFLIQGLIVGRSV